MSLLNFEFSEGRRRANGDVPLLLIEAISVRLGQRLVIDNFSMDLFEGEHVRITGPNGAGKTTLLNAVMGLVPVVTGRIAFKGEDISQLPSHERARRGIRYMRQRDNVFPSLSVEDNLRLAIGPYGYQQFREARPDWSKDIPAHALAGMLSGGQKQKLAWTMTALSPHKLLLADEPTAGVSTPTEMPWSQGESSVWVEHH